MKALGVVTVLLTAWLSGLAAALPSSSSPSSLSSSPSDKLNSFFPRQTAAQDASSSDPLAAQDASSSDPLAAQDPSSFDPLAPQYPSSFDPLSNSVLAVYYGKAQYNPNPSLMDLCNDSDIDMIMMGFIRQLNGRNVQPTFDIANCRTPSRPAANFTAITCPTLAASIAQCQSVGKKVMVSLGGSSANLVLSSHAEAQQAANILWNVFGAGTATPHLRPFGNVTLDGFDFDFEGGSDTSYLDVLSATLQSLYSTASPARFISAAPLCANNTAMPYDFYKYANFIWPRFYNANACRAGAKGFNNSVAAWSNFLTDVDSTIGQGYPRFYIGALGFENYNNGGGFVAPDLFGDLVEYTKNRVGKATFGGVSIWEGTDALQSKTVDGSQDILKVAKEALLEPFTSDACD